jgi:hypothetical protein
MCLIQVILKTFSSVGQVGHVWVPLCDLNQLWGTQEHTLVKPLTADGMTSHSTGPVIHST